jgi:GNAT superfamily N-acetyltransferase
MTNTNIKIRKATQQDVPDIVRLLTDDILGSQREALGDKIPQRYYDAFAEIDNDPNQYLAVAELEGKIIGTFQINYATYMSLQGAKRATIESVRVDKSMRGNGIGEHMFQWAIDGAKQQKCHLVQLTTNKQREDAHRFYERLGFVASHEGYKLSF